MQEIIIAKTPRTIIIQEELAKLNKIIPLINKINPITANKSKFNSYKQKNETKKVTIPKKNIFRASLKLNFCTFFPADSKANKMSL